MKLAERCVEGTLLQTIKKDTRIWGGEKVGN